jgi:hypothetical protein
MGAAGVKLYTEGLTETRALLRRFEPDLLKRLDLRVSLVARKLKSGAQANFEQTGASGDAYRIRTRNRVYGFSKSVSADFGSVGAREHWSTEPGVLAAIFELANGVRNSLPQNVQRTKSLIATLNSRYGSPGRFLWQAWDDISAASLASIVTEIKDVEAEYTARML